MEVIYNLEKGTNRPIIKLDDIFPGCTALLDTGAIIPVWTKDTELLKKLGAVLHAKDVKFSGFGGETKGDLYKMNLKLGNIIYPGLPIVVHNDDEIPGYFIFSATMFKDMIYTIDDIAKKIILIFKDNQVCRNLSVVDTEGKIKVLVNQ